MDLEKVMRGVPGLLLAIMLVASAGCAPNYRDKSAGDVRAAGKIVEDEFSRHRVYVAPPVQGRSSKTRVDYSARLAATQSKADGSVVNSLYVEFTYMNNRWLFIQAAALPGGIPLSVVVNDRLVDNCGGSTGVCSYTERMTAILPLDVLVNAKDGLRVSFQGTVVELPASYVLGYLQGLSAALGAPIQSSAVQPAANTPTAEPISAQPSSVASKSTQAGMTQEQQLDELANTPGLSYEEYQRRYRVITGQR